MGTSDGNLKEPADFDWENYLNNYTSPYPTGQPPAGINNETSSYEQTVSSTESLHDHLRWQIQLMTEGEINLDLGREIIGNLNDDGYLIATLEEIAAKTNSSLEEAGQCLKRIQQLDPPGVAARSLKECLSIQAHLLGGEHLPLLLQIIDRHLGELQNHNYSAIAKKLKITHDQARDLAEVIHGMEPKPGRPYNRENPQYITPDVYVIKLGDDYEVFLNEDGLPKLRISGFYRRALQNGESLEGNARNYLQGKFKSALWLIKSIHQRQRTLYKVTKSILKFQRDFFDRGVCALRPMILRDIAEDIDMHESTVSRVTTNKYVHTPRGIFELKYFFSNGVSQSGGRDVAAESIKNRIAKMIQEEDPRHPLSDSKISRLLKNDNIIIARRTIAKYRESMTIPPSSRRRRME